MFAESAYSLVTVQCNICGCDVLRSKGVAAANEFFFCSDCYPERRREINRKSYWKNVEHSRKRKRRNEQNRRNKAA